MTPCDLFISYHHPDRDSVEIVRQILSTHEITSFLDYTNQTPGLPWPQALEQAMHSVRAVAVFVGEELGFWQKREMYFALDHQAAEERAGRSFPVIPVLLPRAQVTSGFLFLNTWVDLRKDLTSSEAINSFVRAIRGEAPPEPEKDAGLCPYQGLNAFREENAGLFFGREALSQRLLDKVREEQGLVAVIGPSGSGKSSIVYAGFLPLLRRQRPPAKMWDVVSLTPGRHPFRSLSAALIPLLEPGMSETDRLKEQGKLANLLVGDLSLVDVVQRIIKKSEGTDRLLIIIDQFEELITLAAKADRAKFLQCILEAGPPVEFVFTLRADFYGHVIGLSRELSDRLEGRILNVSPMTRDELERAVVEPAHKLGFGFEAGLVSRLLIDSGQEPGRLPLIEFALWQLWQQRRGRVMTHAAYDEFGGVTAAINNFADAQLAIFKPDDQAFVRRIFSRLVRITSPGESGDDTRRRASFEEFGQTARPLIDRLADVRLLVTARDEVTREETVEVSHEALIREWSQLRAWLNEDREFLLWRQRLGLSLTEWHRTQRDAGGLLRGALLTEAERWQASRDSELNESEREFILVSVAVRQKELLDKEQEQRRQEALRKSRIRVLAAGLVIVALLAVGLGVQWSRAIREGQIAQASNLRSQALQLMNNQPSKLDQAALLAIESLKLNPTQQALALVRNAFLLLPQTIGTWQMDCLPQTAKFSFGAEFLACLDDRSGKAKILTIADGKELGAILIPKHERVWQLEASPDGNFLGIGLRGGFQLYDARVRPPQLVTEVITQQTEGSHTVVTFSANGKFAAAVFNPIARRTTVYLFSRAAGKPDRTFQVEYRIFALRFSSDGRVLGTLHEGATSTKVTLFDVDGNQSSQSLDGGAAIASLGLSNDASWVAVPELDSVIVTNRQTTQVYRLSSERRPQAVALTEDGLYAATAGEDGAARVLETTTDRLIALVPTGSPVRTVAFTADKKLALVSEDKTVRTVEIFARPGFESWPIGVLGISPRARYLTTFTGGAAPELAIVDRQPMQRPLRLPAPRQSFPINTKDPAQIREMLQDLLVSGVLRYSSDENTMVATSPVYGLTAYDIQSRKTHHEPAIPGLAALAISGDGKTAAWATAKQIEILRTDDGSRRGFPLQFPNASTLELSVDGNLLAIYSRTNRSIVVFDIAAKNEIFQRGTGAVIVKAVFSPGARYLALSSQDKNLMLVELRTGKVMELKNVENTLLLFSNSGSILATGGGRESQRRPNVRGQFPFAIDVIETATGKLLTTMEIAKEAVGAAFAPNDGYIEVVDETSLTRHYLRTEDLIDQTCKLLDRDLRPDERDVFMAGISHRPACRRNQQ